MRHRLGCTPDSIAVAWLLCDESSFAFHSYCQTAYGLDSDDLKLTSIAIAGSNFPQLEVMIWIGYYLFR
jgi:hypothetical protein